MGLVGNIITWAIKQRLKEIREVRNEPIGFQEQLYSDLIKAGKNTRWGKKYGYKDLSSYNDFAQKVPISQYEDMYPHIHEMMKGKENILWPGPVRWYSKSSGTTNDRSKYIPVSRESLRQCHFKAGTDMIALYLDNVQGSKVLNGKTLALGGSLIPNKEQTSSFIGDVSAVIMKNLPFWAQYMRAPKLETALLADFEEKLNRMVVECASENITSLSGVPTWMVVLVQKMLEANGRKTIMDIWPNLELFLHGAVSFKPYRQLFQTLIPNPEMRYMEIYNASEGFFGIQDDLSKPDEMLLMANYGIFYEFIPTSELGKSHPQTCTLGDVEAGKNYAVVISTNAGLWRYMIGDTVRFTSVSPYRITISGRTKQFINTFGEELIVENAEAAVQEAAAVTQSVVTNYTAAPVYMGAEGHGAHEWLVEFEKEPEDLDHFASELDNSLRKVNSDYDAKRFRNLALQKPILRLLPNGTFNKWLKLKGKLGGQHKVPRLSNTREYVEDILNMLRGEGHTSAKNSSIS